ncbi:Uncharacterized protein SCF082_LOCUS26301, partial [Durusdinium trenchii]
VVLTLPPEFTFNGFDSFGPAGTRIGAYGFEFDGISAGPDRLFAVYSIDADSAFVDTNLDGNQNALKPQIEHSRDGAQNHLITITLPRGGDGTTAVGTAGFSSDIMASLRSGIFSNPAAAGDYTVTLDFTSVDPDSGDAHDNAGTPPETFQLQRTVTIGNSPLSAAVLPNSRSVTFNTAASAFATLVNGGNDALANCRVELMTVVKGGFSYQTTDPNTNALTGTVDTPVAIPAAGRQSFVIAFTPVQEFYNSAIAFTPEPLEFAFICDTAQAPVLPGVNTLNMSADTVARPDVIAIGATQSGDGILYLGGQSGRGGIGIAGMNIGAAGAITVTPRAGLALAADAAAVDIPAAIPSPSLALSICETTNQAGGACLAAPTPSLTVNFATNEVRTFTVLAVGQGQAIANDPAVNRVFLDFTENGAARGGTSAEVEIRRGVCQGADRDDVHAGSGDVGHRFERHAAGRFQHDPAGGLDRGGLQILKREIVEQHDVGTGLHDAGQVFDPVDLAGDADHVTDHGARCPNRCGRAAGGGNMIVLDQDRIGQVVTVRGAASGPHGLDLEGAQAGRCLARVHNLRLGADNGIDIAPGQRGDAAHAAKKIQCRAFGQQDVADIAGDGQHGFTGFDRIAIPGQHVERDLWASLGKGLDGRLQAADHTIVACADFEGRAGACRNHGQRGDVT